MRSTRYALLAESVLKSPIAQMTVGKPQGFFMPVNRGDCSGWVGVRITVEAVPAEAPEPEKVGEGEKP